MLVVEWSWVLVLRWRSLGELSPFDITWSQWWILRGLWWTNVLNSALPPQRHRPDTQPEYQDPVNHMAQKKREKNERKKEGKKERKEERKKETKKERKKGRKEGRKEERKKLK